MDEPRTALEDLISNVHNQHPDAGALRHLSDAILMAERLDSLGARVVGHYVEEARGSGASWAEVGHAMGVSKQAAQKRFVDRGTDEPPRFAGFSPHAQAVVAKAAAESTRFRHHYIGTEHLLLGLIHEQGTPTEQAIDSIGLRIEYARTQVEKIVGLGEGTPDGILPLTARAWKVLDFAADEAGRTGEPAVQSGHILLGLIRETKGVGAQMIKHACGDLAAARQLVLDAQSGRS